MSEQLDPFELLSDLNPTDPGDLAEAASSAEAREALEQILAGTRPTRRAHLGVRLPRLRRRTYLLALVPLAAGITAAAWALSHGATKQLTIGCYASASLQAHTVVVPAGNAPPISICRGIWQRGEFGAQTTLPKLQACVLASGAIAVFPSPTQTACQQLNLAPLAPTTAPPTSAPRTPPSTRPASPVALKDALVRAFLAHRCMDEEEATKLVQATLTRLHLTNWRVQANGVFTTARPCASLGFDEEKQLVLLVPVPRQP